MAKSALTRPRTWTPTQIAALVFGVWWISNGITVFVAAEPGITALDVNGAVRVLGASIAVNGWHGLFHLLTGLAGVLACWWPRSSRLYVVSMGALYLAAAFCSVFTGATVFGLIRVDELGSADHGLEGAALIAIWLLSAERVGRSEPHVSHGFPRSE